MRVIIIGAGKVGFKLAEKLSQENHEVLVIEQNEDRRKILQEYLDVLVSGGNGASSKRDSRDRHASPSTEPWIGTSIPSSTKAS